MVLVDQFRALISNMVNLYRLASKMSKILISQEVRHQTYKRSVRHTSSIVDGLTYSMHVGKLQR